MRRSLTVAVLIASGAGAPFAAAKGNPIIGACDVPTYNGAEGFCFIGSPEECDAMGGVFQGPGVNCPPPAPYTGACYLSVQTGVTICFGDTEGGCTAKGGTFNGSGTQCSVTPPLMQCWFSPEEGEPFCTYLDEPTCELFGGVIQPGLCNFGLESPMPFTAHGTLMWDVVGFFRFVPDFGDASNDLYTVLTPLPGFQHNECVLLSGWLVPNCALPDASAAGCLQADSVSLCLIGDLDLNGQVGLGDLGILLSAFGVSDAGDLDLDGDTDLADLGILLAAFSQP